MNLLNYILEEKEINKIDILKFFKDNKNPSDNTIHSYAEKIGINKHKFKEMIYELVTEYAEFIFHNNIDESKVDKAELAKGIKIELEHTTNKDIAKKNSLDHLSEISDYYTRLIKMEKEAEK